MPGSDALATIAEDAVEQGADEDVHVLAPRSGGQINQLLNTHVLSISRASRLRPPESRDDLKKGFVLPSDLTSRTLSSSDSVLSAEVFETAGSSLSA